jgi:hypothetical protein
MGSRLSRVAKSELPFDHARGQVRDGRVARGQVRDGRVAYSQVRDLRQVRDGGDCAGRFRGNARPAT